MHIVNWESNRWSISLQGHKACTAKLRLNPISITMDFSVTQSCVPLVMTITGVNCMSEVGGSRRIWRNLYRSDDQQTWRTISVRRCLWTNRVYPSISPIGFEMGWLFPFEQLSAVFLLTSDELSTISNAFISISISSLLWLSANCFKSSWLCSILRRFSCSLSLIDTWYCLSSSSGRRFTKVISCHF